MAHAGLAYANMTDARVDAGPGFYGVPLGLWIGFLVAV
jgi:hypothetical protein